jgi:chemotaxis protein methyltransferase CheR
MIALPVLPALATRLSRKEFAAFQTLIFQMTGISLSEAKQNLLVGRLARRVQALGCESFADYFAYLSKRKNAGELQAMINLVTTNETYFFREPKHFDFLQRQAKRHPRSEGIFRSWSAAASSGEEAYTMAMVLAETLGRHPWQVVGTDISTKVLATAQGGHYPLTRTEGIPLPLLKKYCRKGIRQQDGTLLVARELRERVQFLHGNLLSPPQGLGQFNIIFLRNLLIYFNQETRKKVIANVLPFLKQGGHLIVGHSESLKGMHPALVQELPSIYRHSR